MRQLSTLPLYCALLGALAIQPAAPAQQPTVTGIDRQPFVAATERLIEAMKYSGTPLDDVTVTSLRAASKLRKDSEAVERIQTILDPLCLAVVNINDESRVKVAAGRVNKELMQGGWRTFLVKVHNQAGVTPKLIVNSPNAAPVYQKGKGARQQPMTDQKLVTPDQVSNRWMDVALVDREPMQKRLSGLLVEYRPIVIYSRDAGKREASFGFNIGQGTQDIGFRNAVPILFDCKRAVEVKLNIGDVDGKPTTAAFVIRDQQGRVYPNPARRLAPDFFFHHQIYRESGESVDLPPGQYDITVNRGPEYLPVKLKAVVPDVETTEVDVQLKRWIHIANRKWYSGDHHVHAAGCAHYDSPTEGVGPKDMMRHILGEDLNVGCVLSWGPCWYTQKGFFEGQASRLSTPRYLMRYDVEVSGFPSSHAGHLCLLNLTEDDYPGTKVLEDWPSWTLPVLKWGQQQGGVVGYSHSGWGLALPDRMPSGERQFPKTKWGGAPSDWPGKCAATLPDYAMPPFDGIGANEYIVAAAHNACDFISTVDTPAIWELNVWYHTLNCGMTTRISGETDFPCIYGDRVGLGRVYVQLDDDQPLNYQAWIEELKNGRSYCGDGLSHILDFAVNGLGVGTSAKPDGDKSRLDLIQPGTVNVTFDAAAWLDPEQTEESRRLQKRRLDEKPYWHIERCRIGDSRKVPVEVIVNGEVVNTTEVIADGSVKSLELPIEIKQSSWIAVRILPSVHTNPIFVHVDEKPIRANRRSAQWCIDAVDTCWESKQKQFRGSERAEAKKAYDEAKAIYQTILAESE